jgi:phosphopantothenoylcysteine decarboxylase/phosphopantothenate--cysteine ligase
LDIVGSYGFELSGKRIVLCVAGSVAVYKAIELARLLMRHGGDVVCVVSNAATKLVKPDYFKWATGNRVITKLTGDLEHIDVADYKRSDLIIVYPGTANTLGKLANGIDDTPVSTVLTVGFGSGIPIVMALAMHESMYHNKAVKKNIDFLKNKIDFVAPNMVEGKAKAAEPEDVLEFVLKKFGYSSTLHELPNISQLSKMKLERNMAITVEPGIYIPKNFGVRIEDSLMIGTKAIPMHKFTKELMLL